MLPRRLMSATRAGCPTIRRKYPLDIPRVERPPLELSTGLLATHPLATSVDGDLGNRKDVVVLASERQTSVHMPDEPPECSSQCILYLNA